MDSFKTAYAESYRKAYLSVYQSEYDGALQRESVKDRSQGYEDGFKAAFDNTFKSAFDDSFAKGIDSSDFKDLYKNSFNDSQSEGAKIGEEDGFLIAYYSRLSSGLKKTHYALQVIQSYDNTVGSLLEQQKNEEKEIIADYYNNKLKHDYAVYIEQISALTNPIMVDQSADITLTLRNLSLRGVEKGRLQLQVDQGPMSEIGFDVLPPKSKLVVKKAIVGGFKNEKNKLIGRFTDNGGMVLVEKIIDIAAKDPRPAEKCTSAYKTTCKGKSGTRFRVCRAESQTITLCNLCVDGKTGFHSVPVDSRNYYHDLALGCDRDPQIPAELMVPENIKVKFP